MKNYCQGSHTWIKILPGTWQSFGSPSKSTYWLSEHIQVAQIQRDTLLKAQTLPSCQRISASRMPGSPQTLAGLESVFFPAAGLSVQAVGVSLQRVDPSQRSAKLFHSITHGRTEARRRLLAQDPPLQWSSKKYAIFFLPIRLERSFSGEPRRCNTGPKCLIQSPSHSPIVCSELFLSNMLFPACSVQYRRKELIIEQKYLPNWAPGSHNLTKVSQ